MFYVWTIATKWAPRWSTVIWFVAAAMLCNLIKYVHVHPQQIPYSFGYLCLGLVAGWYGTKYHKLKDTSTHVGAMVMMGGIGSLLSVRAVGSSFAASTLFAFIVGYMTIMCLRYLVADLKWARKVSAPVSYSIPEEPSESESITGWSLAQIMGCPSEKPRIFAPGEGITNRVNNVHPIVTIMLFLFAIAVGILIVYIIAQHIEPIRPPTF